MRANDFFYFFKSAYFCFTGFFPTFFCFCYQPLSHRKPKILLCGKMTKHTSLGNANTVGHSLGAHTPRPQFGNQSTERPQTTRAEAKEQAA